MNKYIIIVLLLCCSTSLIAQVNETKNIYIGISGGLTNAEIGLSRFTSNYGFSIQYVNGNDFISLNYDRLLHTYFSMKEFIYTNDDGSNYNRIELRYGQITSMSESQKFLRYVYVGYSLGLSYNLVKYYNMVQHQSTLASKELIGVPIGLSVTNSFSESFFSGVEWKYYIIAKNVPYTEFCFFIKFNIY
jgi:hypothetical protein